LSISDEVRTILTRKNRKEIAHLLNVTEALLSQWASGKQLITELQLAKLVELLGNGSVREKEDELLHLFLLLWHERIERAVETERKGRVGATPWNALALGAMGLVNKATVLKTTPPKASGRTLNDFPSSFYPLAIIAGDKREESASRITAADFGAVSASHAEFRWLCELALRDDVELYGDKVFVLESAEELKARFGQKHLLIVGSPGSNHLARRCLLEPSLPGWRPAAPIFRFNVHQYTLRRIEDLVSSLHGMTSKQLVGKRADESTERDMKQWLHYLFTGGILDPTYSGYWLRGHEIPYSRDYGLITLARNPFSDQGGQPYMCIMAAGFHLPGTAHALRMLARPEENFARHPLGGVIQVSIDPNLPFAKRFDDSSAQWDDEGGYSVEDVSGGLKKMQVEVPPTLHVSRKELEECLRFVSTL